MTSALPFAAAAAAPALLLYCGVLTSPARLPPAVRAAVLRRTSHR